ncbi:MAG: hypothetical protein NC429_09850 [Lachnospiraceae bacterium]|nr:hypothetical protein [Lachnospiraceae bacterium]
MKFVKRISLFFIYPLTMFSLGFASNMAIMEYFYPGGNQKSITVQEQPKEEKEKASQTEAPDASQSEIEEPSQIQVSVSEEPVVTANTQYILQEFDAKSGHVEENLTSTPDKFIGLSRDRLAEEIESYNQNPSLTDLEKGFLYMELVSFSRDRVVVRKSYEPAEEAEGFFLLNENHYVVVYYKDLSDVYMNTDILVEELPQRLQEEIINMKFVEDEGELYNFLESYSS